MYLAPILKRYSVEFTFQNDFFGLVLSIFENFILFFYVVFKPPVSFDRVIPMSLKGHHSPLEDGVRPLF